MFFLLSGYVLGHMEMSNPAPRRSKFNPSYSEGNIDYDMTSPLDQVERKYPCIGYPPGPPTGTYKAGGTIPAKIVGDAPHNGGHCQFSLSYDGNNFVALDTILGDCPNGRDYSVKLPPNAPKGNAVFAWTWINRSGNREFYMNCADIKIDGPSTGAVTGHEMLVGNLKVPRKHTYEFHEDFDNSYGKSYFSSTPVISISPSGASNADGSSTPATYISPSSAPNADGSSTSATYFYPSSAPNADGASTPVISVSPSGAPNAEGAQDEEGSDESSDDDKEGTDGSSNNGESADESSDEEPGLESGQGAKHCPPYTAKHANCPSVPKRKPY